MRDNAIGFDEVERFVERAVGVRSARLITGTARTLPAAGLPEAVRR